MAKVAFSSRAAVGLHIVPEVVIGQFQDTGEKREQSPVDGLGEVGCKGLDFVHEGVQSGGHATAVFPFSGVPVELFDAVRGALVTLPGVSDVGLGLGHDNSHLEAIGVFVSGPLARLGVEEQTLLIFAAHVLVIVLCDSELPMKLLLVSSARHTLTHLRDLPARLSRHSSPETENRLHGWHA